MANICMMSELPPKSNMHPQRGSCVSELVFGFIIVITQPGKWEFSRGGVWQRGME